MIQRGAGRESLDWNGRSVIGVDVGGTNIRAGRIGPEGEILANVRVPTPIGSAEALVAAISETVRCVGEGDRNALVGVAVGGRVDASGRRLLQSANIRLADVSLADSLERRLGQPCLIINDADAALSAEHRFGAAREADDVVMVTVGTGVGGSAMVQGRLLIGAHSGAGEAGHTTVKLGGRLCGCGGRGCLDQYGSGRALWRYASAGYRAAGRELPSRLDAAAQSGDPIALAAYDELALWLGRGICDVVALLDPAVVLLGGGVATAGHLLTGPVTACLGEELARRGVPWRPTVYQAALGDDGGMIGAAVAIAGADASGVLEAVS